MHIFPNAPIGLAGSLVPAGLVGVDAHVGHLEGDADLADLMGGPANVVLLVEGVQDH